MKVFDRSDDVDAEQEPWPDYRAPLALVPCVVTTKVVTSYAQFLSLIPPEARTIPRVQRQMEITREMFLNGVRSVRVVPVK